jgi:hypothetical protein
MTDIELKPCPWAVSHAVVYATVKFWRLQNGQLVVVRRKSRRARAGVLARRAAHHLRIARGFAAWCFFCVWPSWRGGWLQRVGFSVLPYAGDYAYADDPWVAECRRHWIRTGRERSMPPPGGGPF